MRETSLSFLFRNLANHSGEKSRERAKIFMLNRHCQGEQLLIYYTCRGGDPADENKMRCIRMVDRSSSRR